MKDSLRHKLYTLAGTAFLNAGFFSGALFGRMVMLFVREHRLAEESVHFGSLALPVVLLLFGMACLKHWQNSGFVRLPVALTALHSVVWAFLAVLVLSPEEVSLVVYVPCAITILTLLMSWGIPITKKTQEGPDT